MDRLGLNIEFLSSFDYLGYGADLKVNVDGIPT
jgi:hypothetical protein